MVLILRHFIDFHKALTALLILLMMAFYDAWQNTTLWVYLGTHGIYCLLWLHKGYSFQDKFYEQPNNQKGLLGWAVLTPFWINPWYIASNNYEAPPWLIGLSLISYAVGMFYHFVSDMQKTTTLKLKKGLITDGLWARSRNPNYFGEFLTYGGFSLLVCHWLTFLGFALLITTVWIPNMKNKDLSLSRYPEFEAYKKRSGLFFPRII